jgi:hypothetical protein
MRSILIAAALSLAAGNAMADFIASNGSDSMRLTMRACELDNIAQKDVMLAAVAVVDGKTWRACWAPVSREQVYILYEDGDASLLPLGAFRKLPEA